MKKYLIYLLTFLLLGFLSVLSVYAQAPPESFIYQAEARDSKGKPIKEATLSVKITIVTDTISWTVVWEGEHTVTTDKYGLFTLAIGEGTPGGSYIFSDIMWANNTHFLNVQVNDGGSWVDMGTTQFLSVPYALHAKTAASADVANYSIIDNVEDGDANPLNELQNLTLEQDKLKLSITNDEVSLSDYVSPWTLWSDDFVRFTGAVDIGDAYTGGPALRVDGSILLGNSNETRTYGITIPGEASGLNLIGGKFLSGQIYLYGPDHETHPGEVRLKAGTSHRIVIKPDGNVGIGTTIPVTKLDVDGVITATGGTSTNWNTAYGWGDHSSLAIKSNVLELNNTTAFTPDADYEPATKKYVDDNAAGATTYSIGLNSDLGGYIFYVTPDGKHGLVAATQDQSDNSDWSDWYTAQNNISNPADHNTAGKKYTDWRLPTKYELNLMYNQKTEIGGFANSTYWSSTEVDIEYAWRQNFVSGYQGINTMDLTNSIRAVRAF